MSLETVIGPRGSILEQNASAAGVLKFTSPILDAQQFAWLKQQDQLNVCSLDARFAASEGEVGLESALEALCDEAAAKVADGCGVLILSDRNIDQNYAPIPMLAGDRCCASPLIARWQTHPYGAGD